MKNHWLKLSQQKKNKFWTAEFITHGSYYVLRPRIVRMVSSTNTMSFQQGWNEVEFKGGMLATNDKELIDFLIDCRRTSMKGWMARLRYYTNLWHELEYYELSDLKFRYSGMGGSIEDITLQYEYNGLHHVYSA